MSVFVFHRNVQFTCPFVVLLFPPIKEDFSNSFGFFWREKAYLPVRILLFHKQDCMSNENRGICQGKRDIHIDKFDSNCFTLFSLFSDEFS
jgi:hypothetical protein